MAIQARGESIKREDKSIQYYTLKDKHHLNHLTCMYVELNAVTFENKFIVFHVSNIAMNTMNICLRDV